MRKLFLTAAIAASSLTITYAQADLKDVQEKISKGKYDEAKEKLDKILADPKNAKDAGAFYYKGVINTYYAQTDTAGKLTFDATKEAFNAYKSALEIDPKNKYMVLDQNIGLFQLFDLNYNRGVRHYNDKNYDAAFSHFQRAVDLQDFIRSKNFSLTTYTPPVLDTQLVNLTASSGYLAKKEDAAIPYFERIASAKVAGPEFKEVYALIVQHYLRKKDDANAAKYLTIGKQLYNDEDYWLSLEFGANGNVGNDRDAKIKRYEEMLAKYPNNAALAMDYAIEQFNHTYVWEKKPADYTARQAKLQTALDKALSLNQNSALGHFIESQHYYSQIFDLEDERRAIAGNTPAAAAKRKDMNAKVDKKYDDLAAASLKAFDLYAAQTELKSQDKTNYRKVTDQLIDYYTRKKMNDKVTFYQNKKAALK